MHADTVQIDYLGCPFVYPKGSLIGAFIEAGKSWDEVLANLLPVLVEHTAPNVVEVGANIGASLLQMARARPEGRFVCFEPSERFRECLDENTRLAGISDRVEVRPEMLGAAEGEATLHVNASTASAVSRDYDGHEPMGDQTLAVKTLDDVLAGRRVDFLKVDTDGFEFRVLRGARETLRRWAPVVHFEIAPYLVRDPEKGFDYLKSLGYERFAGLSPEGEFLGISGDPEKLLGWAMQWGYCDYVSSKNDNLETLEDALPKPNALETIERRLASGEDLGLVVTSPHEKVRADELLGNRVALAWDLDVPVGEVMVYKNAADYYGPRAWSRPNR